MNSPDVDVVVAGAGGAGLAAALSVSDAGLSVALLEASETFRTANNTSMSTSMIPSAGSRWQAALDIDDSPDLLYEDTMHKTKNQADPVVTRALAEVSVPLGEWLADECHIPLSLVTDVWYPGHNRLRHLCVPDRAGRTLLNHLLTAVEARPEVTLITPLRIRTGNIAGMLLGIQMDDLGIDYVNVRNDLIEAVTLDDVRRVAAALYRAADLTVVVVGRPTQAAAPPDGGG